MGRITEALLEGKAYSKGRTQPMLDLTYGGQMGYAPDLSQWVSNQNYVRRNLFCLLLEAPKFFDNMPNGKVWVSTLRALVELHPRTIEGLNAGLTVEVTETPIGGAGEQQQDFTNVTRARSQPVFGFDEKYGMPIQTFLSDWISYGLMNPDSKTANIGTLETGYPRDMLADQYSMTCIFIEPDPTHRKVVKSWLTTNMYPLSTGDIIGKRDISANGETTSLSIGFTGFSQYNLGSNILAQRLLDNINIANANPYLRPAFIDKISETVNAASSTGYKDNAETLGKTPLARL